MRRVNRRQSLQGRIYGDFTEPPGSFGWLQGFKLIYFFTLSGVRLFQICSTA